MAGNSEAILSHTTNQLHFYKLILQNFTLDRNIMVHNTTNISSKSGCGLINAEALLGGDTTSVHIKSITTDHNITNTVRGGGKGGNERKCTTNAESLDDSKCRAARIVLRSVLKQKRAISASNLLPFTDATSLLKTLLPRCSIVFGPP